MWNQNLFSSKSVVLAASVGIAGTLGICGCKSSHHEQPCCNTCAPVAPYQHQAPPPATAPQDTAPQPAPPSDEPTMADTYEEPTSIVADTAARFEAMGGIVELGGNGEISLLDLSQTKAGNADLEGGTGLANVKQLDLSNTQVTDAALSNPAWLRQLKRLSLNNTLVTDAGLGSLSDLRQLQLLWLNETAVGDDGLARISGLTGLESLGLNKTEVTDAGLAHLKNMKDLKYLLLGQTEVTDAGLRHLRGLSQLKGLSLVGCPVTEAGVALLKEALPNCQIIFDEEGDAAQDGGADDETSLIPRRLDLPNYVVHHALGRTAEDSLPTERLPGFADRGVHDSADSVEITRYYIGIALAETNRMAAALPLLAETVGEAAAYYNIGVLMCKTGRWDQGERQFQTALEINPSLTSARRWLSEIEYERSTIVSYTEPSREEPQLPQPLKTQSDRRSDLSPAPVGVWTKLWDDE